MLRRRLDLLLLAALAYLPTLLSSPGRMVADTKLYLYLDPGRLLSDAPWSWDTGQWVGWVPHQMIGYLWPSGPWFWFFDQAGVPDWIAHRLWIGTVLFAAGAGVRWCARQLGLQPAGALAAALVYQLSPFMLGYVSRASVLLLPFAGLGWIVGLTARAARRGGWRDPALVALVVLTVGGINATALIMVAPAPLIWLADAAWRREVTWRRAGAVAARIGVLCLGVSAWWMAAVSVQSRHGAPVLAYSETLEAVSSTAQANEILRGLGYWLFYVRDPVAFGTTASRPYQESVLLQLVGAALLVLGFAGLALVRWAYQRFAALAVLVAVVLAVGVHPIDDPSLLFRPLAEASTSDLALALRSTTRAVPVLVLGLALGVGALHTLVAARWPRRLAPVLAVTGLLAAANLPVLWTAGFVDPALERDQDVPAAWQEAGRAMDAEADLGRVLQIPGQELGAHRWGVVIDPLLRGVTHRDTIGRDLLPAGGAPPMDLLFALDDRFQDGVPEYAAVAPVARLLGAGTVVFPGDAAFERYRTPRPEPVWAALEAGVAGLGPVVAFGDPAPNIPSVAMVDEESVSDPAVGTPVPPVALLAVDDPQATVRAATRTVLLSGSGAGVVDAAAAGLVDGSEAIVYTADLGADGTLADVAARTPGALVVVTDTNRKQARQWRGSQEVLGAVEPADAAVVLEPDPADHRLPVFPDGTPDQQTVLDLRGGVRASASAYGSPESYRAEDAPAHAVDGDPRTAWTVGDRADVHGEVLRLDFASTTDLSTVRLVQPLDPDATRAITRIVARSDGGERVVDLDDSSRTAEGQRVALDLPPSTWLELEVAETTTGRAPVYPGLSGVGFAEVDVAGQHSEPVLRVPVDATTGLGDALEQHDLAVVLTRWRTDPLDRWRADPEPVLRRAVELRSDRTVEATVTVRLDRRASDQVLAGLLGIAGAPTASARLSGVPAAAGWAALDGDPATAWTTPFGRAVGSRLDVPLTPGTTITSISLQLVTGDDHALPTQVEVAAGGVAQVVDVPAPGADGRVRLDVAALTGDTLSIAVTATDGATTPDRRTAELVGLPVGIAEIEVDGGAAVVVPETLDTGCRADLLTIDGEPWPLRVTGEWSELVAGGTAEVTPCGAAPSRVLTAGEHVLRSGDGADTGLQVDRVVLRSPAVAPGAPAAPAGPAPAAPAPAARIVEQNRTGRTIEVGPCPDGCWLVTSEGYNPTWSARLGGTDLGDPTILDAGMNGWWLPPAQESRTVTLSWGPQRAVWLGLLVTVLTALAAVVLAARSRPAGSHELRSDRVELAATGRDSDRRAWGLVVATGVVGVLVITPLWGLATLAAAAVLVLGVRRPVVTGLTAVVTVAAVGLGTAWRTYSVRPIAGFGWVDAYEELHRPALVAVLLLAVAAARPPAPTDPI